MGGAAAGGSPEGRATGKSDTAGFGMYGEGCLHGGGEREADWGEWMALKGWRSWKWEADWGRRGDASLLGVTCDLSSSSSGNGRLAALTCGTSAGPSIVQ